MSVLYPLKKLFKKFWVPNGLEDTELTVVLPRTNLLDYIFYNGNSSRIYTIYIYSREELPLKELIVQDDGSGSLTAASSGILSTATGEGSTIDYTTNKITIYWDSAYIASLTVDPILVFNYTSDTKENNIEMVEFLGEVFDYYKANELEDQYKYYDPANIPTHLIDVLARDHNWVMDRVYSEDESYLRRQLKFLYNLYKSKRKIDGINFAISVINKRVNFYNLLAEKTFYDDYSKYIRFDTITMFNAFNNAPTEGEQETIANSIQTAYDTLYDNSSNYFPTKHFLLDLALDILTDSGNLLESLDMQTLLNYVLKIKSKSQYPHLQAYLGLLADSTHIYQESQPFEFQLTPTEQIFSVSEYRTLFTGPSAVESEAQFLNGAWRIIPLLMDSEHYMDNGLKFDMTLGDVAEELTTFKIGKTAWDTVTSELGDLRDEFYSSTDVTIIYEDDYFYITLNLDENEGNSYPIVECGIFNNLDQIAFYIKHPAIYKTDSHKLQYKIKLKVNGYL